MFCTIPFIPSLTNINGLCKCNPSHVGVILHTCTLSHTYEAVYYYIHMTFSAVIAFSGLIPMRNAHLNMVTYAYMYLFTNMFTHTCIHTDALYTLGQCSVQWVTSGYKEEFDVASTVSKGAPVGYQRQKGCSRYWLECSSAPPTKSKP